MKTPINPNHHYFQDHGTGQARNFLSLRSAKRAAKSQPVQTVAIFNGRGLVELVTGNGQKIK